LRIRKAQDAVDKLIAKAAQHPLAEPPLVSVDVQLEHAVDDDIAQEGHAERDERPHAVELKAAEQGERLVAERIADLDRQHFLRRVRRLEASALDRSVDDQLRDIERQKVCRHGQSDDNQNPNLLAL
jgi:hypothetical protein